MIYTYACMYVCIYDPNEVPPHPLGPYKELRMFQAQVFYMIHVQPCNYKVVQFSHKAIQGCPSLVTVFNSFTPSMYVLNH